MTKDGAVNPRRANMQANRRRDTGPEMQLRREVFRRGLRYLVDARPLEGVRWRADLVFPRARVAVFIDGCYWHGCPDHYSAPRVNRDYWVPKIAGNRARDEKFDKLLREAGWTVVRAWEHEDPQSVAGEVADAVSSQAKGSVAKATL